MVKWFVVVMVTVSVPGAIAPLPVVAPELAVLGLLVLATVQPGAAAT